MIGQYILYDNRKTLIVSYHALSFILLHCKANSQSNTFFTWDGADVVRNQARGNSKQQKFSNQQRPNEELMPKRGASFVKQTEKSDADQKVQVVFYR